MSNENGNEILKFFGNHDRWYLLLKSHYFFFHASIGSFIPVLNLIVRSRGITDVQIEYIDMIIPFLVFLTNPIIGYLVDHTHRFRLSFNILFSISTILFLSIYMYPSIKASHIHGEVFPTKSNKYTLNFCAKEEFAHECRERHECGCFYQAICTSNEKLSRWNRNAQEQTFIFNLTMDSKHFKEIEFANRSTKTTKDSICDTFYKISIDRTILHKHFKENIQTSGKQRHFSSIKNLKLADCKIKCSMEHVCDGYVYSNQIKYIYLYAFLIILCLNFYSNSTVISTSIGFHTINQSNLFGRQRVWGTIGGGITAFLTSRIYKHYQRDNIYLLTFIITSCLTIILTNFICFHSKQRLNIKTKKLTHLFKLKSILILIKNVHVLIFLFTTFIWGMSFAIIDPYLHLYVEEIEACRSHLIVGYMSLITSIAELCAFFLSHHILKFFGKKATTILIFLGFSIRFFGYYITTQIYLILTFEIMHFFTFGILFALIADEAFKLAPPHLVGTLQGLVYGISFGLGRGFGLWICLVISTHLNKRILFLIFSMLNLSSGLIYLIYALFCKEIPSKSVEIEHQNEQLLEKKEEKLETKLNDGVEFGST